MENVPDARARWLETLLCVTGPVLSHLAEAQLAQHIPPARGGNPDRASFAPMEAFCRSFAGLAPWLDASDLPPDEARKQESTRAQVRQALDHATNPRSPDFLDFDRESQPVVEAAYLALALIRSRRSVWDLLDARVREQVIRSLKSSRTRKAPFNNWLLFPAIVEAFLFSVGERDWDAARIDYAIRQHDQWYKGDGAYGDGSFFHWDYYNSFAIQPMLLEAIDLVVNEYADWEKFREPMRARARRYAEVQERLIAPDGSFPPLGRSLSYRFGAFQHLAALALRDELPATLAPAQLREALTAVLLRTLHAGHLRRPWLADDRTCRKPTCPRRVLHLDRQPLHVRHRLPPAGPAAGPPFLKRARPKLDRPDHLVRPRSSRRPLSRRSQQLSPRPTWLTFTHPYSACTALSAH